VSASGCKKYWEPLIHAMYIIFSDKFLLFIFVFIHERDIPQVDKIATLLLKEMFRVKPDDPYACAVRYLNDPRTRDRLVSFTLSDDCLAHDLLDQD
jgi:hypothetical protein